MMDHRHRLAARILQRERWLFNLGFLKLVLEEDAFHGTCPLCATENSTLALLLRDPPSIRVTSGFPASGSNSVVAFPLAVGNFPETDIISPLICCDACSVIAAENGKIPSGDRIICALPLASYSLNKGAYESCLRKALHEKFDSENVPSVFISILYMRAQRIRGSSTSRDKLLIQAIEWACSDLIRSAHCADSLSTSSLAKGPVTLAPLEEVLTKTANEALGSVSNVYYEYPMEGFIIMTVILDTLAKSDPKLRPTLEQTVFQRLLFHIVEQFYSHLKDHGPVTTHILMSQLLIQDSAKRDRPPGSKERKGSSFRNLAGLTRVIFGDRKALILKLSIGIELLATTPLFARETLSLFKKLGPLFDWIEVKSGHAVAVFLHYLYRYKVEGKSPKSHFQQLGTHPKLGKVFLDPSDVSARTVEKLIELLPPLEEPIDERTRIEHSPSTPGPAAQH